MQKTRRNSIEKAHAKSFSTQGGPSKTPKKVVEPLNRNFFSQLIKLETDFYNKQYTAETLDELTQLYAKAVEYYDTIKDEIASYFIYKIQDALASKKSLKLLIDQTAKVALKKSSIISSDVILDGIAAPSPKAEEIDIKNEVIEENASEENSEDEDDVNVKQFEKKRKAYLEKRNNRATRVSFSSMKNQKQKFVHFFHKMETQKAQQKQNMNTLVEDYSNSAQSNDQTIKSDLLKQKERFKSRLEQRKQKSLMTHTLNSSTQFMGLRTSIQNIGVSQFKKDAFESNPLEDVLKGLEDEEDSQFEASGLQAGQPNQSDGDSDRKNSKEFYETPGRKVQERDEKHALFKNEPIEFSLPVRTGDFEDRSNTDSIPFISPRENESKLANVLSEELPQQADNLNNHELVQNTAQVIEPENISS